MTEKELIVAAQIANPWSRFDLSGLGVEEIEGAVATLVGQKVPLLGLERKYGEAITAGRLSGIFERDRDFFDKQREEFEHIRTAFLGDGIQTMLFKSTGLYPSFPYLSSNLDVLVPVELLEAARRRLAGMGYVELLNVEEPLKFLFRKFTGDGFSYTFHLHGEVGWGVPFVDNEPLWEYARRPDDDPDILIPGPAQALLVTTAHWFYEDKSLSLGNLLATASALKSLDGPLKTPGEAARRRGWAEGYWAALRVFDTAWIRLYGEAFLDGPRRQEAETALAKHSPVTRRLLPAVSYAVGGAASVPFVANKFLYYRKILRDSGRTPRTRARDVAATLLWAVRWKLHIRSHKPLLVTVSGCDGSGKTLQARRLQEAFATCDIRTKMVWARGASSRFMGTAIGLAKRMTGRSGGAGAGNGAAEGPGRAETDDIKMVDRRRALENPFSRFLFSLLYALDLSWTYCVKTRFLLMMGYVVITDRYVYDGLVDYAQISGKPVSETPLALRWLKKSAPRPGLGVVLDVDPDEALRRKPEEGSTGHIEEARRAFGALAVSEGLELIRAGLSPEAVQQTLAAAALKKFYERYGTVVNWLLFSNPSQLNPGKETGRKR